MKYADNGQLIITNKDEKLFYEISTECIRLKKENDKLKKTLKVYADINNWREEPEDREADFPSFTTKFNIINYKDLEFFDAGNKEIGGKLARQVLKEINE